MSCNGGGEGGAYSCGLSTWGWVRVVVSRVTR